MAYRVVGLPYYNPRWIYDPFRCVVYRSGSKRRGITRYRLPGGRARRCAPLVRQLTAHPARQPLSFGCFSQTSLQHGVKLGMSGNPVRRSPETNWTVYVWRSPAEVQILPRVVDIYRESHDDSVLVIFGCNRFGVCCVFLQHRQRNRGYHKPGSCRVQLHWTLPRCKEFSCS
jgi:hypothetical protein